MKIKKADHLHEINDKPAKISEKLIILAFKTLILITFVLVFFILSKSGEDQNAEDSINLAPQTSLILQINSPELPTAKVNNLYEFYLIASTLRHAHLDLKVSGLPEGFTVENCVNDQDIEAAPSKPNTFVKCLLTGIPKEAGAHSLIITASSPELKISKSESRTLNINK